MPAKLTRAVLFAALIALCALAACGGEGDRSLGASCMIAIEFRGTQYADAGSLQASERLRRAEDLGRARQLCVDGEPAVAVAAVAGIDAKLAVVGVVSESERLMIATGSLPELRAHPLHDALFGGPHRPSMRPRCRTIVRTRGRILESRAFRDRIAVADRTSRRTRLFDLHARTAVERAGGGDPLALAGGENVAVTGRSCPRGGPAMADTITVTDR